MSLAVPELVGSIEERYAQLVRAAEALVAGEHDRATLAASLSSLVYHSLPDLNWVGFYFHEQHTGDLVVGPYQGKPACIRIPSDRGVCGAAARSLTTQRVADVHAVPDHIACDPDSRSELVVPLAIGGQIFGVFDLDSPVPNRFTEADQAGLEAIAEVLLSHVRTP
ncbi:GAF domain-containing protein [Gordonia sp. CPCC 206044]|uniref:GAF domain-containing protein n=1 Tax=Gordonia sp. CPCC 206044 TaxID=3140793 RepID=UPI003AF34AEA